MRVIFSVYIDFDENEFDKNNDLNKNIKSKKEFKDNYEFLKTFHEKYANEINVKYILYENDYNWKDYKKHFEKNYPYVSKYNIVNFYKIQLMYDLLKKYDEILYLDFDVVPLTKENIFDAIETNNGIACKINHERDPENYLILSTPKILKQKEDWFQESGMTFSERDPRAKYWNCRALLMENGFNGDNDVYNTGIILANRDGLNRLNYFENFDKTLEFMHQVKSTEGLWPSFIQSSFGYDNETLFSFKMKTNEVNLIELDDIWHWPYRRTINFIPKKTKMVHVINKNFEFVKKHVKKYNL
tara:strand:+ start:1957 stop:2856 length:900 start_codon:yes stop_codon:yes gene_type:complete